MILKNVVDLYILATGAVFTIGLLAGGTGGVNDEMPPEIIRAVILNKDFSVAAEKVPMDKFDVRGGWSGNGQSHQNPGLTTIKYFF